MARKIRVLVGKPGLDGHDRGAKVVAAALRDSGMEVIYTGLHQTPEQVVEAAVQEDVDVVALSILSGAHMTLFPEIQRLMVDRGIGDKLVTGGGIIPPEDMETLRQQGVGKLFGPGSSTQDIIGYIREWFGDRFGADALPPLPAPPEPRALVYESETPRMPASAPRRPAPKAAGARKTAARKKTARKTAARKTTAPKTAARKKTARKKTARRKTVRKKTARRKAARKPGARRAGARR